MPGAQSREFSGALLAANALARRDGLAFRRSAKNLRSVRADATFTGLDGAVLESGMYRARTLDAHTGRAARTLRQLRSAASQRAPAAATAFPHASAAAGELSSDRTSALESICLDLQVHGFRRAAQMPL